MSTSLFNILTRLGLLLCLLFSSVSIVFAQQIGKVRLVIGAVQLDSSVSGSKQLELGDQIFQGDQITTPATGYAVVTLIDDSKFTIKPNSVFKFNEVANQTNGKVLTELVKGGLKAISGTIGAQNPSGFKVDTPLGSIGIRGTNFDAILCQSKGDNCIKLHEALGCPQEPPDQTEDLLYVTATQGTAYLDDCQDDPDINPGQVGITDGTASSCKVVDEIPCFMQEFDWQQEQQKDQTLKSLEVPVLQIDDIKAFCQGDPICIQCEGDPSCIQCDGDPDCIQCQGDPICIQCLGDPLCIQCQGDPLCIQCDADPQCIQCQADQICILCMGDPICEVCQGDQVCIDRLNNPMQPSPIEPDPMQPDPMQPDPMQPDPMQPDPMQPDPMQPDPMQPDPMQPDPMQPDPMEPMCDPDDINCICMMNPNDPVCPTQCPPNDVVCECDGNLDCICSMDPQNPMCAPMCTTSACLGECGVSPGIGCICAFEPFQPFCSDPM